MGLYRDVQGFMGLYLGFRILGFRVLGVGLERALLGLFGAL